MVLDGGPEEQPVKRERLVGVFRTRGRPPTANDHRSKHWRKAQSDTARVRGEVCWAAKLSAYRPPAEKTFPLIVEAWPHYENRRSWPDTGACQPALKAAIDGLVDAGWLPGDTPDVIGQLRFHAATVTEGYSGMLIRVLTEVDHRVLTGGR